MYFLLFFALPISVLIWLSFVEPVEISFLLDSDDMDMRLFIAWLRMLRIEANLIDYRVHVSVRLFGLRIISGFMKKRKKADNTAIKSLSLRDTSVRSYYGLREPFSTGIMHGFLILLGEIAGIEDFEQYPDFVPESEYLRIEASSNLNLGKTIANFMQNKLS